MSDLLQITNNGPLIEWTNYWETNAAAWNKFIVSCNAGAIRLLIPEKLAKAALPEMKTAFAVIIRRGRWKTNNQLGYFTELSEGTEALEFLFEDNSDAPYSMHGNLTCASDVLPGPEDQKRNDLRLLVYTREAILPQPVLELPAFYRVVNILPDLKSIPLVSRPGRYGFGKSRFGRN